MADKPSLFKRAINKIFGRKPVQVLDFQYTPALVLLDQAHAFQQEQVIKPAVVNPVLGYKHTRTKVGDDYESVEYDLSYIYRVEDVESYLSQAHHKKLTLLFKEGYDFVGEDPKAVNYVKKRLQQIAEATNISTKQLLRATADDLIKISNCFWLLVRDRKRSGGKVTNGLDPIAGVFIIPAETVVVRTTANGQITSIQQRFPGGRKKAYDRRNVVHFAIDRKNGFAVGTPRSWPVIEDILALRRIEENVEKLIYRDLFPIYHYNVGTETMPAMIWPDGVTEIDHVRAEIENMPPEGIYVTPERHDMKVIGHEGRALRIEGYIKHFKQRVLAGLNLSSVDVGEGDTSNRSTAETMSQSLIDEVKDLQSMFEDMFDNYVIRPLLHESDLGLDFSDPKNAVHLAFKEIDIATQLKLENHNAQMFSQHAINHKELRNRIGLLEVEDVWWEDSYWKLIEEPRSLILATDEPFSVAAQAAAQAKNSSIEEPMLEKAAKERAKSERQTTSLKASRGTRAGASQDRPSNQRGKKLEPITRGDNLSIEDARVNYPNIFAIFNAARSDAVKYSSEGTSTEWYGAIVKSAREEFKRRFTKVLKTSYKDGYKAYAHEHLTPIASNSFRTVENSANKYIDRIFNDVDKGVSKDFTPEGAVAVFDSLEYRVFFLFRTEIAKAQNYGRLIALKELGENSVAFKLVSEEPCEDCVKMASEVHKVDSMTLSDTVHHPNCSCLVVKVGTQYD